MDKPHIRMYKPDGTYEIFTQPLTRATMETLAGATLTVEYHSPATLEVCYAKSQQDDNAPISCEYQGMNYHGIVFFGRYENEQMQPISPKWFAGINDPFKAALLGWGA